MTCPQHDIPVQSATGYAIAHGRPSYTANDIRDDPNCYRARFLLDHNLTRVCLVPLRFMDGAVAEFEGFGQAQATFVP